jgi:hypothetical protein
MTDEERGAWLAALSEKDAALASHLKSLLFEHRVLSQEQFLERGPASLLPTQLSMAG